MNELESEIPVVTLLVAIYDLLETDVVVYIGHNRVVCSLLVECESTSTEQVGIALNELLVFILAISRRVIRPVHLFVLGRTNHLAYQHRESSGVVLGVGFLVRTLFSESKLALILEEVQ